MYVIDVFYLIDVLYDFRSKVFANHFLLCNTPGTSFCLKPFYAKRICKGLTSTSPNIRFYDTTLACHKLRQILCCCWIYIMLRKQKRIVSWWNAVNFVYITLIYGHPFTKSIVLHMSVDKRGKIIRKYSPVIKHILLYIMDTNNLVLVFTRFICTLMPQSMIQVYFRLPYFHVPNSSLFCTYVLSFYINVVLTLSIARLSAVSVYHCTQTQAREIRLFCAHDDMWMIL